MKEENKENGEIEKEKGDNMSSGGKKKRKAGEGKRCKNVRKEGVEGERWTGQREGKRQLGGKEMT